MSGVIGRIRPVVKILFAALFLLSGFSHLVNPDIFLAIMPPYLPAHLQLVYLSGILEIVLALLLFVPTYSAAAGWGLVFLLIAVFPANLQMALHSDEYPLFNPVLLWIRLPMQLLLISVAYWVGPYRDRSTLNEV